MRTESRFDDLPARIARLPVDRRGYPIPKFVKWIDGEPDFRVISEMHMLACIKQQACWICGDPLGANKVFVIGPMCCINRVASEPPCHLECALFAARHCPFLAIPSAKRRTSGMPEEGFIAGVGIDRNPGVTCLWITAGYAMFQAFNNQGLLFRVGDPRQPPQFWSQGRPATRAEVDHSVETGFPALIAASKRDGSNVSRSDLDQQRAKFTRLLDATLPEAANA